MRASRETVPPDIPRDPDPLGVMFRFMRAGDNEILILTTLQIVELPGAVSPITRPAKRDLGLPTFETGTSGTSFPAGSERSTYRPGCMRGSSILGSRALDLIARPTARIRCDGPRWHRYIRKRAT